MKKWIIAGKLLINILAAVLIFLVGTVWSFIVALDNAAQEFYFYMGMMFTALIIASVSFVIWGIMRKKAVFIPTCCMLLLCAAVTAGVAGYGAYVENIPTLSDRIADISLLEQYAPYAPDTNVAELGEKSELIISENIPHMDGATALYPIYSAFAKAVYPQKTISDIVVKNGNISKTNENNQYLRCTKTAHAYEAIINGESDIIFVAAPSEEQEKKAEEAGVQLVYTPIGREAFVFFVNRKNLFDNITTEQIRGVYSGEITQWSELGVRGLGDIRAFQRDEGSGSQSALERLMNGKNLTEPLKENVVEAMGGIIEKTADYKNYKNAIGYSFRFYSTEMVQNDMIKLLSIDGVYPNTDNIENGTYPLASEFYAVTRSDASENTRKLLDWITGEQGQKLIEMTGYTPIA